MLSMKIRHAIALLIYSLAASGCAATNADGLRYPTLKQDGTVLQSVCIPSELQGLKEQFARYKYKDEAKAWKAVTTLLCGAKTEKNTRYIRNMMAAKVISTSDYTGQDNQPETINASNEVAANLFALGVAYDASIANLPGGMFRVLYTTNEVCGESRTFKYDRNKWIIVGTGEACD
jgi:hypothetical protein